MVIVVCLLVFYVHTDAGNGGRAEVRQETAFEDYFECRAPYVH